ncbi:hypothetical protein NNJEOMEG_02495 [Fundidesulfovibrio magnetotacticus]|uniref:Lipoprotein n=1 Tax=Fundidesulfovibrio magnetotacticus TaxID=2730080 RepID=A0A6V8LWJ6_9BACT|nr:hypothetical protein [Fundidesulfovibrio magnetotacticus]GFK94648.1 hypothetical protein NNJEOMEG_02495 [Fundidesulfovibrio magnetotacticus]
MKRIAMVLALAVTLSACAYEPKMAEQSVLYVDVHVKRNNPSIFVQPMNAPTRPFKAVVLPFTVQQDVVNARHLSKQLTEVFTNTWLEDKVFPALFYEPSQEMLSNEQAILVARDRGADCVVTGRIAYIYAGGTRAESAVSISFEIFDVNSGQRIWSMAQSGRMDPGRSADYIFFKRESRLPQDPLWSIMTAIAHDTGGPIKKWNGGMQFQVSGATLAPVSVPVEHAPPPPPKQPLQSSNLVN